MLDHFEHLKNASVIALPWLAFLVGLGGSLHCVSMCGGLVTACTNNGKGVVRYQFGRLLGYSMLGLFAGTLGSFVNLPEKNIWLQLIPAALLAAMFFWWGYSAIREKKAELPMPAFLRKSYFYLWDLFLPKNEEHDMRPFGVGLFSILLPCGLLYGVVIVAASFQDPLKGLLAMFFFWLGTVPAMGLAPNFMRGFLTRLVSLSPRFTGLSFIFLGILTISWRVVMLLQHTPAASCH